MATFEDLRSRSPRYYRIDDWRCNCLLGFWWEDVEAAPAVLWPRNSSRRLKSYLQGFTRRLMRARRSAWKRFWVTKTTSGTFEWMFEELQQINSPLSLEFLAMLETKIFDRRRVKLVNLLKFLQNPNSFNEKCLPFFAMPSKRGLRFCRRSLGYIFPRPAYHHWPHGGSSVLAIPVSDNWANWGGTARNGYWEADVDHITTWTQRIQKWQKHRASM